eukprot:3837170-Rhodomonas_salina.1
MPSYTCSLYARTGTPVPSMRSVWTSQFMRRKSAGKCWTSTKYCWCSSVCSPSLRKCSRVRTPHAEGSGASPESPLHAAAKSCVTCCESCRDMAAVPPFHGCLLPTT